MGPGAQTRQREYDSAMLLFDVGKDGSVAQIGFPTRAFIIATQMLSLWVGLRAIHIIDYGVNNLFQFDYMIQHSIVSKNYIVFYNFQIYFLLPPFHFFSPFQFIPFAFYHFLVCLKMLQQILYCFDLLTMKLWILPSLFKYVADSWTKFMSSYAKQSKPVATPSPIKEINIIKATVSTHKYRKFSKFNINELSGSSGGSRSNNLKKNKKIQKKGRQNTRQMNKMQEKELHVQDMRTNCRFTDDSGEQISSIGARESQDSQNTVMQFLVNMEPNKVMQYRPFQTPLNNFGRRQVKQTMLAKQLYGKNIKNKIVYTNEDLVLNMKKSEKKPVPMYEGTKNISTPHNQMKASQKI